MPVRRPRKGRGTRFQVPRPFWGKGGLRGGQRERQKRGSAGKGAAASRKQVQIKAIWDLGLLQPCGAAGKGGDLTVEVWAAGQRVPEQRDGWFWSSSQSAIFSTAFPPDGGAGGQISRKSLRILCEGYPRRQKSIIVQNTYYGSTCNAREENDGENEKI